VDTRAVLVADDRLTLPSELFEAMGKPDALDLHAPNDENVRFLTAAGLRSRLKRRPRYKLVEAGSSVEYAATGAHEPRAEYRVANYHPAYYLMPTVDHDTYWQGLTGYHEHRPHAQQDQNAHRVSAWLAGEILAPLGDSFLELGCGAGRNLAALAQARPESNRAGVEVNEDAAAIASTHADVTMGSLYDTILWVGRSFEVVFTSGG